MDGRVEYQQRMRYSSDRAENELCLGIRVDPGHFSQHIKPESAQSQVEISPRYPF
jgi:hypothetical protein